MSLSVEVSAAIKAHLKGNPDLGTLAYDLQLSAATKLGPGIGAGKADTIFSDRRSLPASTFEFIDLAVDLFAPFGDQITFHRIKILRIEADRTNTGDIIVGGAGSPGAWVGPFGSADETVSVRPGGKLLFACSDAVAWPVTSVTGDLLKIENASGAGTALYTIVLVGEGTGAVVVPTSPLFDFTIPANSQYLAVLAA